MDNQRIFVWAALALVLYLCYAAWETDYAPPAPVQTVETRESARDEGTLPSLNAAPTDGVPALPAAAAAEPVPADVPVKVSTIRVVTDVLDMDISTRGGTLQRADLLKYPKVKNQPDIPVRLFNTDNLFVARSGLRAADREKEPTHLAVFTADAQEFRLNESDSKLEVPLTWTDGNGVTVRKIYTFEPGSYRIGLRYEVDNQSGSDWKAASYVQLVRHYEHLERSYFNVETYSYRGPVIYDGKGARKLDVEDADDRGYRGTIAGGWLAAIQHHFVAAAVPPVDATYNYELNVDSRNDFTLSYLGPLATVPAGAQHTFTESLFVGPKLQAQLEETGPRLELVADYGALTIISRPLFILLSWVYDFVGNWGLAIIIVTFLIKLAFYRLTASSGRSMAKMRALAPRIKAIQERYKDDREQLGRQMMEIYKREKINPLAGCLPILIQIPVFLAFYWVLLESVEMRQAPFVGWITDLSVRDPYFILPVIMGAAMFLQFKLQPMPSADPVQQKIFAFMPVIMAATMVMFPSGLVLYWLTNTLLSILQQWRINKLVAAEEKKAHS
jgi:YidC/Oxa1 family membrane protein insertase